MLTNGDRGTPRRVLVIGAQGFLGSFIAATFTRSGWHVTRGGRRAERAADFRLIDVDRPETVREACRDVDLVVSTVRSTGLGAERAVLEHGPTLFNLDDLPSPGRARLRTAVAAPRGLVIDRTGLYGVVMMALGELLARHPDADTVEYGFLASPAEHAGRAGAVLMHRMLTGPGRRRTSTVDLPAPFGRCRTFEAGPEAAGLLADVVGGRAARAYVSFRPAAVNAAILALNALGVASRVPASVFALGAGRTPGQPSRQPTAHWVNVRRGPDLLASRVVRGAGDYRMSAATTLILAETFAGSTRRGTPPSGLFGIDELVTLGEVAPALAAQGITVEPRGEP
jgi:hypothetical protein